MGIFISIIGSKIFNMVKIIIIKNLVNQINKAMPNVVENGA